MGATRRTWSSFLWTHGTGPKLEIFGSRVFTQIRPVWVGDLGTRPKNSKFWLFKLENRRCVLSHAEADIDKKNCKRRR